MANTTLFIKFMGDSPTVRILDYLLTVREVDFSITDIAENAGIGRATLYRVWDDLTGNKILIPTREIGRARLYKLNMENPKIRKLAEIYDMIILEELRKKAKPRKIPA